MSFEKLILITDLLYLFKEIRNCCFFITKMKSLHIWFVFFVQFSKVNRCFSTTLNILPRSYFQCKKYDLMFLSSCATTFNNLTQDERDVNE